jgi:hypothetical protein
MFPFIFGFQTTTLERETAERQNELSGWRAGPASGRVSDFFPGSCLFSKEKLSNLFK